MAAIIFITGVSGCGKSTVGRMLAETLGCRFLEGDDFHSADCVAKMRAGIPLEDEDRWPWLDRLGGAALAAAPGEDTVVVSCSALRRAYRDRLQDAVQGRARFVQLQAERGEIARRVGARAGHFMPGSLVDSQYRTLEPLEPAEPAIALDASLAPEDLCARIATWLGTAG